MNNGVWCRNHLCRAIPRIPRGVDRRPPDADHRTSLPRVARQRSQKTWRVIDGPELAVDLIERAFVLRPSEGSEMNNCQRRNDSGGKPPV